MSSHFRLIAPAGLALVVAVGFAGCKQQPAAPATAAPAEAPVASTLAKAADALNPLPDAKDQVKQVTATFLGAKSFHATMTHGDGARTMTNEVDFVAPDRYRMVMPMGTQYIIGDTMIMTVDGRSMKMPMPKGTLNFRDMSRFSEHEATMTVESLGSEVLDGRPTRKYVVRNTQPEPSESTMWIGADGYPQQIQVNGTAQGQTYTTTIRYSRFNDPGITIDPPQ